MMMTAEREALYARALAAFGDEAQEWMLVEELAELLQALNKFHRASKGKRGEALANLLGEFADASIMIEQIFVRYFGTLDRLRTAKASKLALLDRRLEVRDDAR